MTTYRQTDYEKITAEIREEEEKKLREENKNKNTDLKTSKTMASPKDMLTDKELDCVTSVFRSFETGLRGATIDPSVSYQHRRLNILLKLFVQFERFIVHQRFMSGFISCFTVSMHGNVNMLNAQCTTYWHPLTFVVE